LLNDNVGISRTVNGNIISDTRTNRLGKYVLLSFNLQLRKFAGKQPERVVPADMPERPPVRL
jgi:hypothetical protein